MTLIGVIDDRHAPAPDAAARSRPDNLAFSAMERMKRRRASRGH